MASKGEFSSASPDYGTPGEYADSARVVFDGEIDLDPASSLLFNDVIRARHILTREIDGLAFHNKWRGNVMVNPPGDSSGSLVKKFWEKLINQYCERHTTAAIWIGFNINQLQTLQQTLAEANPLDFPLCFPKKRIAFSTTTKDHQAQLFGEPERELIPAPDPGHPNFICLLPDRDKPWQTDRFYREFSKYGAVKI